MSEVLEGFSSKQLIYYLSLKWNVYIGFLSDIKYLTSLYISLENDCACCQINFYIKVLSFIL